MDQEVGGSNPPSGTNKSKELEAKLDGAFRTSKHIVSTERRFRAPDRPVEADFCDRLPQQEPVTLHPGQTFYEGPNDIHVVGRNASNTEPAKFLVVFIKNKGAPILTPVE